MRKFLQQHLSRGLNSWQAFATTRASAIALISRVAHGRRYAALVTWRDAATSRLDAMEAAHRVVLRLMQVRALPPSTIELSLSPSPTPSRSRGARTHNQHAAHTPDS